MIYKIVILNMIFILGVGYIWKYNIDHSATYQPKFRGKECFIFRAHNTTHPDGYVTVVGDLEYTVMWYKEAYKRYAGPKMGYKVPIKWLDEYAYKTGCPWVKKQ